MEITFKIDSDELNGVIKSQIKEQAILYFKGNEASFVNKAFEKNLVELKQDGFFKRQVSSVLNKAIYDKVNRDCASYINSRVEHELDKVFKNMNIEKHLSDLVDKKVKEKLSKLMANI